MTQQHISDDAKVLTTRIPEGRKVDGLEYGDHVTEVGWSGYYVRPAGTDKWGVARQTPAGDEVYDTDEEIVGAIGDEL